MFYRIDCNIEALFSNDIPIAIYSDCNGNSESNGILNIVSFCTRKDICTKYNNIQRLN